MIQDQGIFAGVGNQNKGVFIIGIDQNCTAVKLISEFVTQKPRGILCKGVPFCGAIIEEHQIGRAHV